MYLQKQNSKKYLILLIIVAMVLAGFLAYLSVSTNKVLGENDKNASDSSRLQSMLRNKETGDTETPVKQTDKEISTSTESPKSSL